MSASPRWMQVSHESEGVRSLELVAELLPTVFEDPYRWKWVLIAAHNSLQAFLVDAVSGSDLLGAMDERTSKAWREAYEKGDFPPPLPERLAHFPDLVARAKSLKGYVDSKPLELSQQQEEAIDQLTRWRNRLVHYTPMSLSIEVSGFPDILSRTLEVIEFLAFESNHVFRGHGELPERTTRALRKIREALAHINEALAGDAGN